MHKSTTHEECFMHIDTSEIGIALHDGGGYLSNPQRITVFARKEGSVWWYTVAKCHRSDQFCRKTGRNIARRRYFSNGQNWNYRRLLGAEFDPEALTQAVFLHHL